MVSTELRERPYLARFASRLAHSKILYGLISVACSAANAQLDPFLSRLVIALIRAAEISGESKQTNLCLSSAKRLKSYGQAFRLLAAVHLQSTIQHELDDVEFPQKQANAKKKHPLSLVTTADVEKRAVIARMARRIDTGQAAQLSTLRFRLSHLIGRDALPADHNPFRSEVFLAAIDAAWCEFNPDVASHAILLPLLRPEVFLDLAPILATLNQSLIASGVLPELAEQSDVIEQSIAQLEADSRSALQNRATPAQLRPFVPSVRSATDRAGQGAAPPLPLHPPASAATKPTEPTRNLTQGNIVNKHLLKFLSGLHRHQVDHQSVAGAYGVAPSSSMLGHIKKTAPSGALTRVDENIIDRLTEAFNAVFSDRYLPTEIKGLIGILQIPALEAALADPGLFINGEHPAKRLIDLLVRLGNSWDQVKGKADPTFQVILRNVNRIQNEFEDRASVFSDAVADLASYAERVSESTPMQAFSKPVAKAFKQEKLKDSSKAAKSEIAMRIGTGDVAFFVEAFLKSKWVSVLTFAHSIEEEKPKAVESALQTMDDLVWSVKPKITVEERENLVAKLPSMLAMLNKWLKVVELDETEHKRFFSELAECHASIVRAPLKMSPQRKLEFAVNITKQATERRLNKQDIDVAESTADAHTALVGKLERGMWFDFIQIDTSCRQARLMWISPMHSVYVFSSKDRAGSFSLSAEDLARALREGRAMVITNGGWEDRGANDV